jgi:polar amino acid transport system substrate-binding protein
MGASRPGVGSVTWALICLVTVLAAIGASPARTEEPKSPDRELTRLLLSVHAEMPARCSESGVDRLLRVLCAGRIRIGVRSDYPQFAERDGTNWRGYEIDLARAIARGLGVDVDFVAVTPANRIALIGVDRIDLAIASIGDNTQRDEQAHFVRPHYYESETILVGSRDLPLSSWQGAEGKTICVTVGNGSNAELWSHGARLMLFGEPGQLLDGLRDGTCSLVAQDTSFFAGSFAKSDFAASYTAKLGFAPVPWGMAVALNSTKELARALALMTQIFHRDGVLLQMAKANRIAVGFLEQQETVWRGPDCNTDSGSNNPACILPPLNTELQPTAFADRVAAVETWFATAIGLKISLPMLETVAAWASLQSGIANSLILIAGALSATLAVALAFGALLGSRAKVVQWATRMLVTALQSTPPVMALVIAATIADAVGHYSSTTLIVAAIAALGLINGANAGQAISEAIVTHRVESVSGNLSELAIFIRGIERASKQIEAFLINAVKGTPIASFIGTPELLNALTDISSFSSERATMYWLLLIFYILIIMLVVWLCAGLRWFVHQWGMSMPA